MPTTQTTTKTMPVSNSTIAKKPKEIGIYFDTPYNPDLEYYFVDYHDAYDCRWVRCPYLTINQVHKIVEDIFLSWGFDKEGIGVTPLIQRLRITPEKELAQLRQKWNEETQKYENDVINERTYRFGGRYDVDEEWVGVPSLNKKDTETQEEWEERVAIAEARIELEDKESRKSRFAAVERIRANREANPSPSMGDVDEQEEEELIG